MAYGASEDLPEVRALGRRLAVDLDYRGLGGVEFKRDAGGPVFIEMSTRLEGFHGLAVRSGVDLAWAAYLDTALGRMTNSARGQDAAAYWNGQTYLRIVSKPGGLRIAASDVPRFMRSPRRTFSIWSHADPSPAAAAVAVEAHRAARRAWSSVVPRSRASR